jgi:hypothetical protein
MDRAQPAIGLTSDNGRAEAKMEYEGDVVLRGFDSFHATSLPLGAPQLQATVTADQRSRAA